MPSWNIHLEAGERISKKLRFSGKEKQEFLVGCLLPDINNGYVNSPEFTYPHHDTHYAFDEKSSLNFYADYSNQIRDRAPIFLGYLFHLFLDGYFNYHFYHNFKYSPLSQGLDEDKKRDIKHHDFWLFDTNFHHSLGLTTDSANDITPLANQIKNVNITTKDLLEVDKILLDDHLNDAIRGQSYIFYTKDALDQVLEDAISEFTSQYLESDTPGISTPHKEPTRYEESTRHGDQNA